MSEGVPIPPNKDDFDTIVSPPGIAATDFSRFLQTENSISVKIIISYTDSYGGGPYETSICMIRLVSTAITFCKTGNDIK